MNERPDEYDLEIFPARGQYDDSEEYKNDINYFLRQLFNIGVPNCRKLAPLAYGGHNWTEVGSQYGKRVAVHVRFELSKSGRTSGTTIKKAAEDFCKRMFHDQARGFAGALTPKSTIGFSALSSVFKTYWTRTIYEDCLRHGPQFFQRMNSDLEVAEPGLPYWALGLSFSRLLAGANFEKMAGIFGVQNGMVTAFNNATDNVHGCGAVGLATEFLRRYSTSVPTLSFEDQKKVWRESRDDFKRCMDTVCYEITKLRCTGDLQGEGLDVLRSYEYRTRYREALCNAVYDATVSAAKAFTVNREMFELFLKLRDVSTYSAISSVIDAGTSMSHLMTSVSVSQQTTTLPLMQWTNKDWVNTFLKWEPPVETSVGVKVNNWFTAAASIWSFGYNTYNFFNYYSERQRAIQQMEYHEGMRTSISAAWGLAYDTLTLLQLLQCTNTNTVTEVGFVDDEAQKWWENHVCNTRQITRGEATEQEFGADAVLRYLDEQRQSWESYRHKFDTLEFK